MGALLPTAPGTEFLQSHVVYHGPATLRPVPLWTSHLPTCIDHLDICRLVKAWTPVVSELPGASAISRLCDIARLSGAKALKDSGFPPKVAISAFNEAGSCYHPVVEYKWLRMRGGSRCRLGRWGPMEGGL